MHVTELEPSPAALVCLRAVGITDVDQLVLLTADELIARGFGAVELYEVVCQLNESGLTLPSRPGRTAKRRDLPDRRVRELLRRRLVEGLALHEVGEPFGIGKERVRQLLRRHFGLTGKVPTVQARRWAATELRRLQASTQVQRSRSKRPRRRGTQHLSVVRPRERGSC